MGNLLFTLSKINSNKNLFVTYLEKKGKLLGKLTGGITPNINYISESLHAHLFVKSEAGYC